MRNKCASEYQECLYFFQWSQLQHFGQYLIKIVNEGTRTPKQAYQLRSIGMRAGLPDYYLPLPNAHWAGLWLEMKRRDRQRMVRDPRQDDWIAKLLKIGHYATYAYGWDEAASITTRYLSNQL